MIADEIVAIAPDAGEALAVRPPLYQISSRCWGCGTPSGFTHEIAAEAQPAPGSAVSPEKGVVFRALVMVGGCDASDLLIP